VESECVLGIAAFWTGEFAAAERHFRAAVARYRPEHRPTHLARYGLDPEVVCTSRLGNTLWFLGRPEPAVLARERALALAAEVGHPHSHHTALVFAALLALELGETQRLREYAAALAERSARLWRPTQVSAEAIGGYLEVLDGHRQAGIARLWRALNDPAEAEHAPGLHASVARLLLAACAAAGDPRAGLAAADRALGLGDHARTWEAETCRLRGQFLAELGAPAAEVDAQLERALRLARRQGAKMLELRAATSLLRHRLGADDRRLGQAQAQLASVVAELGGAAGTQDLRAASTLLARA
jgi:hypothetical protein